MMPSEIAAGKVGIIMTDTYISGTVRRIANMFQALSQEDPSKYHLIINEEVYEWLDKAHYDLKSNSNVHVVKARSRLDFKKWENESFTLADVGRFLTLWNFRKEAEQVVKKENISILQCALDAVYIFGLFPLEGVVQIASLVSHLRHHYDNQNLIGKLLYFSLRHYDLIECITPSIQTYILQNGISTRKVFCAPNSFVHVGRYNPGKKDRDSVVFAARLHSFKNPELYLNAISRTCENYPGAKFHLLGTGPLQELVQRQVSSLEWRDHIHCGFEWDTSTVLNESSIFVTLEEEDNYPNQSLLEGMASGNAIIATDVGLTRRLVDESNGFLIAPSDTRALSEAMIWMLQHPRETMMMGMRSRERVLRENNLATYLDYIEGLYQRASLLNPEVSQTHL